MKTDAGRAAPTSGWLGRLRAGRAVLLRVSRPFVAGLAFRGPVLVVGPLLPEIGPTGIPGVAAVSSVPVLCMAACSRRWPGPRRLDRADARCRGLLAAVGGFGLSAVARARRR
jgi:hypothetical protein